MKAGKIWGQTELIHANGVLEFHRIEFKKDISCSKHKHKFKDRVSTKWKQNAEYTHENKLSWTCVSSYKTKSKQDMKSFS